MNKEVFNIDEWAKKQKEFEQKFEEGTLFQNLPVLDTLIRHKWPEEKPEDDKQYLVRLKFEDGDTINDTLCYNTKAGRWDGMSSLVTHWWNLPEVTE